MSDPKLPQGGLVVNGFQNQLQTGSTTISYPVLPNSTSGTSAASVGQNISSSNLRYKNLTIAPPEVPKTEKNSALEELNTTFALIRKKLSFDLFNKKDGTLQKLDAIHELYVHMMNGKYNYSPYFAVKKLEELIAPIFLRINENVPQEDMDELVQEGYLCFEDDHYETTQCAQKILDYLKQRHSIYAKENFLADLENLSAIDLINRKLIGKFIPVCITAYHHEKNGEFPLRTLDGSPLEIVSIDLSPLPDYPDFSSAEKICTIFSEKTDKNTRLKLMTDGLKCEIITQPNPLDNGNALLGHRGVFTTRAFKPNEFITFHSGIALQSFEERLLLLDTYLFNLSGESFAENGATFTKKLSESTYAVVDGDAIGAMINTIFSRDQNGIIAQAKTGYNAFTLPLKIQLKDGSVIYPPGIFALRPLLPGEELRLHYGYSEIDVNRALNSEKPV
ncbi:SET domain-containing protein [Paraburkholderia bonniea]|uniref:SET domain-containing protein n=1 Tax=Paraburkholderia bonniea TaxID=2152891 RepID=UPI0012917373|nr:SET domain-containing protein [Paraburkholderia bonniea]